MFHKYVYYEVCIPCYKSKTTHIIDKVFEVGIWDVFAVLPTTSNMQTQQSTIW